MNPNSDAWVFDTGPLRHFAAAGWTGALRFLAGDRPAFIPDVVERELRQAQSYVPAVESLLAESWVHVYSGCDLEYLAVLAEYEERLVVGEKNRGECGVLAMGRVFGCEIVLDDSTPRVIAEERQLRVKATVGILCDAVKAEQLTLSMVESLADHLLESEYYLPFTNGGFRRFVLEEGLLDYDDLR